MTPIQVQVLNGPQAGQRLVFSHAPVTFGRGPENTLIVQLRAASRAHGRLVFEEDQWFVEDFSSHGTQVRGKRVKGSRRPLQLGDTVSIAGRPIFQLIEEGASSAEAEDDAPAEFHDESEDAAETPPRRSRRGLLIALAIYGLALAGIAAFLGLIEPPDPADQQLPVLSDEEIADAVRQPLPSVTPDPRDAADALRQATRLYLVKDTQPDALFESYRAYQAALAYSDRTRFEDGLDQIRFMEVQDRLVHVVTQRYRRLVDLFNAGQYDGVVTAFGDLEAVFPDYKTETRFPGYESRILRNAGRYVGVARDRGGRGRR